MKALVFIDRRQVAVRVGQHFLGIRTKAMPEFYSERNRLGWRVLPLPLGLRAFYRSDRTADRDRAEQAAEMAALRDFYAQAAKVYRREMDEYEGRR